MPSRSGTPSRRWSARAPACDSSPRGATSRSGPCGTTSRPAASAWSGPTRSSRTWRTSSCRSSIASARRACASSSGRSGPPGADVGSRLHGIIAKEFLQLGRDRLALTLMLFVPVAMLFIFGWAINTDVKHVPTAVVDLSGSVEARKLLEAFENSQYFDIRHRAANTRELTRMIDDGSAKVGVVIPPDYARELARKQARVQVIVDASDPQVATSAMNAAAALGADRSLEILTETAGGAVLRKDAPPLDLRVRAWYNPDLVSAIFIVPGLIGALLLPIEGMPRGAQYIASIIPLTYYLRIVRGIVLKGIGLEYLWPSVLPLVAFGAIVFSLSIVRFRKQLD